MKRTFILTAVILFICIQMYPQSCFPDGVTFSTQEQIDSFSTNYPDCKEVLGDMTISGEEISNLEGLSQLTSIGGELLLLANPDLINLTGLHNITYIGSNLRVINNPRLQDLQAFNNLRSIEGDLVIGYIDMVNGGGNDSLKNLEGLNNVTMIKGSLIIQYNNNLIALSGLDNVTFIGAMISISGNAMLSSLTGLNIESAQTYFYISLNHSLHDFSGLNKLTSVGKNLSVYNNDALTSLNGLENLTSIGNELRLQDNPLLSDLSVLEGLKTVRKIYISSNPSLATLSCFVRMKEIEGSLTVRECHLLNDLEGLDNLTTIGGSLSIWDNDGLTTLMGLSRLTYVGAGVSISKNDSLTSLSGIDNINMTSANSLYIKNNLSLSSCEVKSVCDFLAVPNAAVTILFNAPGCGHENEVIEACENSSCLAEGITFTSLEDVENFQNDYPECTKIEGDLTISGSEIEGLFFLSSLRSIGGDLRIINSKLQDLQGLGSLMAVYGSLIVGDNAKGGNAMLQNMDGLPNLAFIEGDLNIENNSILNNIEGLNIDSQFLKNVTIRNNPAISSCDVEFLCKYLGDPLGNVVIENNSTGCNSGDEVIESCALVIEDYKRKPHFTIYPNPATNTLTISGNDPGKIECLIYNQLGQVMLVETITDNEIDLSGLDQGLYIVELTSDRIKERNKLIIRR